MQTLSVIAYLWLLALAAFVGLLVYRAQLTRRETAQLFLDDNADDSMSKREHESILRRVHSLNPFVTTTGGATAVLTVAMIGVELAHALPYVHF